MNLDNIGISYSAGYLLQGNQLERCKKSLDLNIKVTELLLRSDKKDFDIDNIKKIYDGFLIFHIPAINPNLSNLKNINDFVKDLAVNNIKLITINASNLSLDLFEWSTLEEQKKYFLNIVTSIATIASNNITVAIDNLSSINNPMFGCNLSQITDIIVYSRKMLVKDFGFKPEEAEKRIGLSLNIDNIDEVSSKEKLLNWIEVFNNSIKCIKISNYEEYGNLKNILRNIKNNDYYVLLKTEDDLDDINKQYLSFINMLGIDTNFYKNNNKEIINQKISSIIIIFIILITIIILTLMFAFKYSNLT